MLHVQLRSGGYRKSRLGEGRGGEGGREYMAEGHQRLLMERLELCYTYIAIFKNYYYYYYYLLLLLFIIIDFKKKKCWGLAGHCSSLRSATD